MRRYRRYRIVGALAAICIALSGILYLELKPRRDVGVDLEISPNAVPAPRVHDRQPDTDALLPPVGKFSELVERPLFLASRRPPARLPGGRVDAAAPVDFVLHGIVITNDERFAIFVHGTPSRVSRRSEGQELQGWTVQSILSDRVLLEDGDRRLELRFIDRPPARERSSVGKSSPTGSGLPTPAGQ